MKANPVVDRALNSLRRKFQSSGENPDFIVELVVLVADADGHVDQAETAAIHELLNRALSKELTTAELEELLVSSRECIEAVGLSSRARTIGSLLSAQDVAEDGIRVALAVAYSSDGLSEPERVLIEQVAYAAGLTLERFVRILDEVRLAYDLGSLAGRA